MSTPAPTLHGGIYWDSQKISTLKSCPKQFSYRYRDLQASSEPNIHLSFGKALASGIEASTKEGFKPALLRLAKEDLPDHGTKTREALVFALAEYEKRFPSDEVAEVEGVRTVEFPFLLPFSETLVFCGHLDRVVNEGRRLAVVDQKTTGKSLSSYYFQQFFFSDQIRLYALAAKEIFGYPIYRVYIDGISITKTGISIHREPIDFSADIIEEWLGETVKVIEDYQTSGDHPQNFSFQCPSCRYAPKCLTNASSRNKVPGFVHKDWKPEIPR